MLTAFVILCITGTTTCETHDVPVDGNAINCAKQAQLVAQQHYRPGMTVARFGCRRAEQ